MTDFLKALSVFTGTVIGVGIFGLPYIASKAGFLVVCFYFAFMALVAIAVHYLFAEVVLATHGIHRLPGYVEKYLGPNWKKISFIVFTVGLTGALLAYLIVGGQFLYLFFAPLLGGTAILYTLLFFSLGAYLIFRGIKDISQIEFFLLLIFFTIIAFFSIKSAPLINLDYLKTIDWKFFAFPYGVILFALWGNALIPELKEMLRGDREKLRKVILFGISIAAITYLFFVFIILGVSGVNTSKEAISGLVQAIGNGAIRLGFIFGIITCFTSFITLGLTLKKVFWYDMGLSKNVSWFIACFTPLFLFFIGLREFINVIGFTGAIALGLEGIIVVLLYKEFLKQKFQKKIKPYVLCLPLIFILGIILEIFYFLSN